jgi:hypothetical protein
LTAEAQRIRGKKKSIKKRKKAEADYMCCGIYMFLNLPAGRQVHVIS